MAWMMRVCCTTGAQAPEGTVQCLQKDKKSEITNRDRVVEMTTASSTRIQEENINVES